MPHCQKENHNHAAKSKKERKKAKVEQLARKKRLQEEREAAEAEEALKLGLGNNIAPVEGHGAYEIGYEEEPEYTKFNVKKRSKKHLRKDLRKAQLREMQEDHSELL